MTTTLDKSALLSALEAFWDAPTGNDKGVEAAIVAYLERTHLTEIHDAAVMANARWRDRIASIRSSTQAAE